MFFQQTPSLHFGITGQLSSSFIHGTLAHIHVHVHACTGPWYDSTTGRMDQGSSG